MLPLSKIMVVDDDRTVRALFGTALAREGFQVVECPDGLAALDMVPVEQPSLIILDVEMPRLDGWKTLAELRRRRWTKPGLMVTHIDDPASRVQGLELGADDYIGKPCVAAELVARVRALLRRVHTPARVGPTLRFGDIVVDLERKSAKRGETPVGLTRTEFALLELLGETPGAPVSRERMIERVWGGRLGSSNTLDTHLWRMRRKLGDNAAQPQWIRNLPGIGYVLSPDVVAGG